jgi:small subunit ribosomal protein S20
VANTRSAEKRMRQDRKRNAHNRTQRSKVRTAIKKVTSENDPQKAETEFKTTAAMLDRMASRRLIHPNKAARKKSQLAKAVKKLGKQS